MTWEYDTTPITTKLNFIPDFSGLEKATNGLKEWQKNAMSSLNYIPEDTKKNVDDLGKAFLKTRTEMSKTGIVTTSIITTFDETGKAISKVKKELIDHRKKFEFWSLSIMFFGMQMKRVFGGMWKDMNTSYTKITENTTALGQANLRLSASMTFLQVSIMTALEPILIPLVETIIDLVNWFNELPEPIKQVAGLFIVGGYFTGGIMQALGSITMFVHYGLTPFIAKLTSSGLVIDQFGDAVATTTSKVPALGQAFLAILPWIIIVALTAAAIWKEADETIAWNNKMEIDKSKGDWDAYKTHALARALEMQALIPKVFTTMFYWIGDAVHTGIETFRQAVVGVAEFIIGILSALPGEAGETWRNIGVILEQGNQKMIEAAAEVSVNAAVGYSNIMENIKNDTISKMIEMGVPLKDIQEVYKTTGDVSQTVTRDMQVDLTGIKDKANAMTADLSVSASDITTKIGDLNNQLKTIPTEISTATENTTTAMNTSWQNTTMAMNTTTDTFKINTETKITDMSKQTITQFDVIQKSYITMTNALIENTNTATAQIVASFANATASVNAYIAALSRVPSNPISNFVNAAASTISSVANTVSNVITGKKTAEGGVFTKPDIRLIGEAGPEAVIPLDRLNMNQTPSINVGDIKIDISTGPINNDVDIKDLANKVSDEIMKDIRNYTKYVPQW